MYARQNIVCNEKEGGTLFGKYIKIFKAYIVFLNLKIIFVFNILLHNSNTSYT